MLDPPGSEHSFTDELISPKRYRKRSIAIIAIVRDSDCFGLCSGQKASRSPRSGTTRSWSLSDTRRCRRVGTANTNTLVLDGTFWMVPMRAFFFSIHFSNYYTIKQKCAERSTLLSLARGTTFGGVIEGTTIAGSIE